MLRKAPSGDKIGQIWLRWFQKIQLIPLSMLVRNSNILSVNDIVGGRGWLNINNIGRNNKHNQLWCNQ